MPKTKRAKQTVSRRKELTTEIKAARDELKALRADGGERRDIQKARYRLEWLRAERQKLTNETAAAKAAAPASKTAAGADK